MIRINNIYKAFAEKQVLNNVCAEIPDTGIFAISAPSGQGKTTLLRILCSLEQPDSGNITGIKGKKISVVFQEDRLLPWCTALENVSCVSDKAKAIEILSELELQSDLDKKPHELSGGMCRRVALARALAFNGDILLLDEPFKGLDRKLKSKILEIIKVYSQSHCVILVTHDEDELSCADKILKLK